MSAAHPAAAAWAAFLPGGPVLAAAALDRNLIEVGGKMYLEVPKNRKQRRTIYKHTTPRRLPAGRAARGPRRACPR